MFKQAVYYLMTNLKYGLEALVRFVLKKVMLIKAGLRDCCVCREYYIQNCLYVDILNPYPNLLHLMLDTI